MKDKLKIIGKHSSISCNGLKVFVKVLDVKNSYGRTRYLVTPLRGEGQVWTENIYPL